MEPSVRVPVPPGVQSPIQPLPCPEVVPEAESVNVPFQMSGEDLHSACYASSPCADRTLLFGKYFLVSPFFISPIYLQISHEKITSSFSFFQWTMPLFPESQTGSSVVVRPNSIQLLKWCPLLRHLLL
jgi:hypothetical protein